MWVGPPSLLNGVLRSDEADELRKEAHMEVYVGMNVHRKRSQVALLDHDGGQLLNRNLPNDPAELTPILGALAPDTPVAFEAAYGWGWLADLLKSSAWNHTWSTQPAARQSPRPGSRTTRSMPAHWRTCYAPICCPRRGSPHRRSVISAPCCATAPRWCAPGPR